MSEFCMVNVNNEENEIDLFFTELNQFVKELASKRNDVEHYKKRHEDLLSQITQLKEEKIVMQNSEKELIDQHNLISNSYKEKINNLEFEKKQAETKLKDSQTVIENFRNSIAQLKIEKSDGDNLRQKYETQIKTQRNYKEVLEKKITETKETLTNLYEIVKKLNADFSDLKCDVNTIKACQVKYATNNEHKNCQINELRTTIMKLRSELFDSKVESFKNKEKEPKSSFTSVDYKSLYEGIQRDCEFYKSQYEFEEKKYTESVKLYSMLLESFKETRKKMNELQCLNKELSDKCDKMLKEWQDISRKLTLSEEKNARNLTTLRTELEENVARRQELLDESQSMSYEMNQLKQKLLEIEYNHEKIEQEKSLLEQQCHELKKSRPTMQDLDTQTNTIEYSDAECACHIRVDTSDNECQVTMDDNQSVTANSNVTDEQPIINNTEAPQTVDLPFQNLIDAENENRQTTDKQNSSTDSEQPQPTAKLEPSTEPLVVHTLQNRLAENKFNTRSLSELIQSFKTTFSYSNKRILLQTEGCNNSSGSREDEKSDDSSKKAKLGDGSD